MTMRIAPFLFSHLVREEGYRKAMRASFPNWSTTRAIPRTRKGERPAPSLFDLSSPPMVDYLFEDRVQF